MKRLKSFIILYTAQIPRNKISSLQQIQTPLPPTATVTHLCSVDTLKCQVFIKIPSVTHESHSNQTLWVASLNPSVLKLVSTSN